MDTSTTDDEVHEALRSAYEVNLPSAPFTVEDVVLGGRLRRRRRMARKVAGVAVVAAALAGGLLASSSAGVGTWRTRVTPAAGPSSRASLTGAGRPSSAVAPPPGASAAAVIDAYLRALVAGDCATTRALATSTFTRGNGELCGDVKVSSFTLNPEAVHPGSDEVIYGSVLATSGSSDGSIAPGKLTWFYDLKRKDGTWKLVSGGSGP